MLAQRKGSSLSYVLMGISHRLIPELELLLTIFSHSVGISYASGVIVSLLSLMLCLGIDSHNHRHWHRSWPALSPTNKHDTDSPVIIQLTYDIPEEEKEVMGLILVLHLAHTNAFSGSSTWILFKFMK